jgi:tetratricopeptide (TPR) repeat protein
MSKRTHAPLLHALYNRYLVDQNLGRFAARVAKRYEIGTLERLSVAGDRMARRAAVLVLGQLADYGSNAVLGRALQDVDRGVRMLAENCIRMLWCRDGTDAQRRQLEAVITLNSERRFQDAIGEATKLLTQVPSLAEAWNQRALALFSMGRLDESIHDCTQALEINPYHYGAATGMAQCYLQCNNRTRALECFHRALRLNSNLEGVRAHVLYLQRTLKSQE